jgi:zinc-ribbon domain
VRCGRCGNENAEGNRFCGMCGSPLTARSQSAPSGGQATGGSPARAIGDAAPVAGIEDQRTSPRRTAPHVSPPSPRPSAATSTAAGPTSTSSSSAGLTASPPREDRAEQRSTFHDEPQPGPVISGPSFLGLNVPGMRNAGLASGGDDNEPEHLRSSGNVNYLLEDDEEPKRGWGKLVLILVALVLAGSFGYLRWKQGGFDWLTTAYKKPAQAQPSSPEAQSATGNGNGVAGTPAGAPPAAPPAPVPSGTAAPTAAPAASSAPPANAALPQDGSAAAPPPSSPATPPQDNSSANSSIAPAPAGGSQTSSGEPSAPADAASGSATSPSAPAPSSHQEQQPAPIPVPPAAVPKPAPTKAADPVAEAQRYIYGRGVRQDCDRGLRMLKSAADRSDARAMISLGRLYSTGTCAPRDLPTAYRWFAGALHKDPENQGLQDDLQKLWSQMTQPERQLAIKLTQ